MSINNDSITKFDCLQVKKYLCEDKTDITRKKILKSQ